VTYKRLLRRLAESSCNSVLFDEWLCIERRLLLHAFRILKAVHFAVASGAASARRQTPFENDKSDYGVISKMVPA